MTDAYTDEVAENQGRLFELACYKGYNMEEFTQKFMGGIFRYKLDYRDAIKCNMFFDDILEELLRNEQFTFGGPKLSPEICCWVGEFYSILRDTMGLESKDIIQILPFAKLYNMARTLHDIDIDLAVEKVALNLVPIICFHNPGEPNDYLSNWYYSDFIIRGIRFNSVEQCMMYSKAMLFHDIVRANQILKTRDFRYMKKLGREVNNYDEFEWSAFRFNIVKTAVQAKFSQNKDLAARLISTGNALLAECAVHDRIWGIGLSMTDHNRLNPAKWRGQNNLGKILMSIRSELR